MIDPIALGLTIGNVSGDEIQVICPFHDDHSPSASFNMKKGVMYCFACGSTMKARQLARELGGDVVGLKDVTLLQSVKEEKNWRPFLYAEQATDHPYLLERKVTNGQVARYNIKDLGNSIGFPLNNRQAIPCGVQTRRTRRKSRPRYVLYGDKAEIWPYSDMFFSRREPLLVEGIFGVLRLERCGIEAFATLSSQVSHKTLLTFNGRRPTIWFDTDYAGCVGAAKLILFTGGEAILDVEPDTVNGKRAANRVLQDGFRTSRLDDLADESGDSKQFWKHITIWQRKYMSSSRGRQTSR
jgi:hypothetical protein